MYSLRIGNDTDDSTPAEKYYTEDQLGSCSVAYKANAQLINLEEFYPFGETSFGSYSKKRYRYCGKQKDEESGYYNYGQRYYAPWLCRFISVDPLAGKYAQLTPYNYAGNKPITHTDINGLAGTGNKRNPDNLTKAKPIKPQPISTDEPVANVLLPEVKVTGLAPLPEGTMRQFPGPAQIDPRTGHATVRMETKYFHRGVGPYGHGEGWYSRSEYANLIFNLGKQKALTDEWNSPGVTTSDIINHVLPGSFITDGRPLTQGFVDNFLGVFIEGYSAGGAQRTVEGAGTVNSVPVFFDAILAGSTLGGSSTVEGSLNLMSEEGVSESGTSFTEGSFSVSDWAGYPSEGIKPSGPFRLLEGEEYKSARNLANSTNSAIRRADPSSLEGLQIHEVHPIKFGGSPTDLSNKIYLTPAEHAQYTRFWNSLMRNINKVP